jgi:hypothetical protein
MLITLIVLAVLNLVLSIVVFCSCACCGHACPSQ